MDIDISKTGDGGLKKRIIKEGTGTEVPNAGFNVKVHYTGTLLDGTKFDSSKDRDEPFQFKLGNGQVIKAWDIGVATMKRGEVCMLTCAPEYAYGARGCPPQIPPNATLQFEIEMIDWEDEDLSPGSTRQVLRRIMEQGSNKIYPTEGSIVTVELEGKLPDGKVFDTRTVTFTLGDGFEENICKGIEVALYKFTEGEKSKLTIQPKFAFKSNGDAEMGVPPDSVVEYIVKLTHLEMPEDSWMTESPKILEQATIYKEKGTKYFKETKYTHAIKMYKKVIKKVESLVTGVGETQEIKDEAKALALSSRLNLALAYLKLTPPQYFDANKHATKVLEYDPDNVKGLFRQGQANLGLGEPELAMKSFQRVVEIEPQNKAASNQIIVCKAEIRKNAQKYKQVFANMFEKFAKHDTEVEKIRAKNEVDVIGEKVGEWGIGEGEWTDEQRDRKPTEFEKENPNILMLDKEGQFMNM